MKIAILSDIHANSFALDVVLDHAKEQRVNEFVFLGDAIGYLSEPVKVLSLLASKIEDQKTKNMIFGNHEEIFRVLVNSEQDWLDKSSDGYRNNAGEEQKIKFIIDRLVFPGAASRIAISSIRKNYLTLLDNPEQFEWLKKRVVLRDSTFRRDVKLGKAQGFNIRLVHGSLREPRNGYVWPWDKARISGLAREHFQNGNRKTQTNLVLFGHTHIQTLATAQLDQERIILENPIFRVGEPLSLEGFQTVLLNPGSVGLPRDGDPRASYAIADLKSWTITFWKLSYETEKLHYSLSSKGYPNKLSEWIDTAPVSQPKDSPPPQGYLDKLQARKGDYK